MQISDDELGVIMVDGLLCVARSNWLIRTRNEHYRQTFHKQQTKHQQPVLLDLLQAAESVNFIISTDADHLENLRRSLQGNSINSS